MGINKGGGGGGRGKGSGGGGGEKRRGDFIVSQNVLEFPLVILEYCRAQDDVRVVFGG